MAETIYQLEGQEEIPSPNLVYYLDLISKNADQAMTIAGSPDRLWPHVKSHKMESMVKFLQDKGINRFKTATIAETEMVLACRPKAVLMSYPLVGQNIPRFIELAKRATITQLWATGDHYGQLKQLSDLALTKGLTINLLIDVNMGMNRTGVPMDQAGSFYRRCLDLTGLRLDGLHCYDGHRNDRDYATRLERVTETDQQIKKIQEELESENIACSTIVAGGTPSFPCHAQVSDFYLSPGTLFLHDYNYKKNFPDLDFTPAACLVTRVISHPAPDLFTLDLGSKAIATDLQGVRGVILNLEDKAVPLFQSEEHWVFQIKEEHRHLLPEVGSIHYVIPNHICSTTALYPEVLLAREGKLVGSWQVTARNRYLSV